MDPEITRYAEAADKIALQEFLRNAWGKDSLQANGARWSWLFCENPHVSQNQPTVWLVKQGGEILAHFATIPVRLKIFDQYHLAHWAVDLFVGPQARRKGLAARMVTHVANQVDLLMPLGTNPPSLKLFRENGWLGVGKVRHLVRILDGHGISHSKAKTNVLRILGFLSEQLARLFARGRQNAQSDEFQISSIADFDEGFDNLWNRMETSHPIVVERDRSFLSWRYGRCYKRDHTILQILRNGVLSGYCVLDIRQTGLGKTGVVVDILAEKSSLNPLIGAIMDWFRDKKVNRVDCLIADKEYEWAFLRKGFLYGRSAVWLLLKGKLLQANSGPLKNMKNWHISGGDSDLCR